MLACVCDRCDNYYKVDANNRTFGLKIYRQGILNPNDMKDSEQFHLCPDCEMSLNQWMRKKGD